MKKIEINESESRFTYFKLDTHDGSITVNADYEHFGTLYRASMSTQKTGTYYLSGSVRAVGDSGTMMKKERKKTEAEDGTVAFKETYRYIRTRIYTNFTDDTEIKACIIKAVYKLYADNVAAINSQLGIRLRPESITPIMAVNNKINGFLLKNHPNANEETQRTIELRLKRICAFLPNTPMMSFKKNTLKRLLDENSVGRDARIELSKFWQYCIDYKICLGTNPLIIPPKTSKKASSHRNAFQRIDRMTLTDLDDYYQMCGSERIDGPSAGAALFAGACLHPKKIETLLWKDIIFKDEYDNVVVSLKSTRKTDSTQNYSKPLTPQAAVIIHKRYEELKNTYDEKRLSRMPVCSLTNNPEKPMKANALLSYVTLMIQKVCGIDHNALSEYRADNPGMAAAYKIICNTYEHTLLENCNLEGDSGTVNFLMGRSLEGDTTNSNYVSFTAPESSRRIYSILSVLKRESDIRALPDKRYEDGTIERHYVPNKTSHYVEAIVDIVLDPGEYISIKCPHGVKGFVITKPAMKDPDDRSAGGNI